MTRKASVKKIAEQKRQNEIKKKEEEARQAQVAKLNKLTVAANTKEVVADSDSSDSEDEGVKEKWVRRGSKEAKTVPAFDFIHNPMSEKEAHGASFDESFSTILACLLCDPLCGFQLGFVMELLRMESSLCGWHPMDRPITLSM